MGQIIPTCKIALGVALALAGAAAEARRSTPDALGRYARARMADATGATDEALAAYAQALTGAPDSSAVAYRTYREAVDAGDRVLALRAVRALDRLDAMPPDGPLLLFLDHVQRGDWRAAERELDRVESAQAFGFMVPVLRAWMLFGSRQGDPQAALEGRVRDAVGYGLVREQRGLLMLAQGQAEAGAASIRDQEGQGVYQVQLRLLAAARLQQLKRADLATSVLAGDRVEYRAGRDLIAAGQPLPEPVSTARAGLSEMMARVALVLLAERAPQTGLLLARFAQFAEPERTYPRLAAAVLLNALDKHDAALRPLEGLQSRTLARSWVDQTRYEILRDAGQLDAALAHALMIAERTGAGPDAFTRLGDSYSALNRHKDAADAYGRAIALVTQGRSDAAVPWHFWLQQGREAEAAGDWPNAYRLLKRAVAAGPDQATALNHLGYSMLENGEDSEAALKLLQKASTIRPDDAAVTDSLGWAWVQRGDLARGIPLLEQAAEREPGLAEISEHLGDAYWKAGRRIDARYAWRNALVQSDGADAKRLETKIDFGLKPKR